MNSRRVEEFLDTLPQMQDAKSRGVFYSKFRPKESDPEGYTKKLQSWSDFIYRLCNHVNKISFTPSDLSSLLEYKGLRPECIVQVMEEMEYNSQLKTVEDFTKEQGWGGWLFDNVVKKPLLSFASPLRGKPAQKRMVHMKLVEERAEKLMEKFADKKLILLEDLASNSGLSKDDLELCFSFLRKTKKAHSTVIENGQKAFKFTRTGEPINDVDTGILHLELTMQKLEEQKSKLEAEISKTRQQALEYKKKNNKSAALLHMKRMKNLEEVLNKRLGSQHTIQDILDKIEDAHSNAEIIRAYELGAQTIRSTTEKLGLSKERVDSVMMDLEEVFADQREIDDAMKTGTDLINQMDDPELEEELAKLEKEVSKPQEISKPQEDSPATKLAKELDKMNLISAPKESPTPKTPEKVLSPQEEDEVIRKLEAEFA